MNWRTIREELNWYYTRINIEEQKAPHTSGRTVQTLVQEVQKRENELMKYRQLILPIHSALRGRRAIVFVPHGFMHYIPFRNDKPDVQLWDVHDQTTACLMKDFYSQLAAGRTRWQGLRSAIIKLKETRPHPYYWAPFIGIGAP